MDHNYHDDSHDQHYGHSQDNSGGSCICQDLLDQGPQLLQEIEDFFNQHHGGGGQGPLDQGPQPLQETEDFSNQHHGSGGQGKRERLH